MGLKDKFKKKVLESDETDEFPDEFESSSKQVEKDDLEIKDFVKKNVDGKKQESLEEKMDSIEEGVEKSDSKLESNFTTNLRIQVDVSNYEKTKSIVLDAVSKGYVVAISVEKRVTTENAKKVCSILKYLASNQYDTLIVASKIEAVFNE